MTAPKKPVKPEFFTKRVAYLTLFISGATYYWFAYRPWAKRQKHLSREREAKLYWELQNKSKSKQTSSE